jgi:pimeloyl-ACP methyl ester carboxylesterase
MIFASLTGKIKRYESSLAQSPVIPHLIWGEQDRIMPVENARALQALIPNAKLDLVSDSGHLPHQEKPEDFLNLFFGSLTAS